MFDTVRKWAYKAIRAHRGGIYNTWLEEVVKHCLSVNEAFLEPLPYSEVKATAKSIATYCWKKDGYCYQEFIDRQSRKGALGGKARSDQFENRREEAKVLRKNGLSIRKIAKKMEVSPTSIQKWLQL